MELTDLPPPAADAMEGYYLDPLGSGRARWWDGRGWTPRVGPTVDPKAAPDQRLTPPDKVCPRCDVRTRTFDANCPHCGTSFSRSPPWKIALLAVAGVVLGLGGCGALGAVGLWLGEKELEKHSITRAQFEAVPLGSAQSAVEERFGEPISDEQDSGQRCLVYDEQDENLLSGDFFELCFEDGRLARKDAY